MTYINYLSRLRSIQRIPLTSLLNVMTDESLDPAVTYLKSFSDLSRVPLLAVLQLPASLTDGVKEMVSEVFVDFDE